VSPKSAPRDENGTGGRPGNPDAVDPSDVFTRLAATCVPAFCDGVRLDLYGDGGSTVNVSYPPTDVGTDATDALSDTDERQLGTAEAHEADGNVQELRMRPGRIVIAIRSEPTAGEPLIGGTITCTWRDHGRPTEVDTVVGRMLADRAMANVRIASLANALQEQRMRAANLELALATNREIGQAIGILMATHHLTASQAFDQLRKASQHAHRKLREIAADVVETGTLADARRPATAYAPIGLA
jgi:ANTAR domain